jgi:hypothetical protein
MQQYYKPVTKLDVLYWAQASRAMPKGDVEKLQSFLRQRALDCGYEEGVPLVISSMTDRFADEEREEYRRRVDEHIRRLGIMERQRIDATDEQIVKAIKRTLSDFESKKDWGGVYRILVDYCQHLGFTATKTNFVKRFAKMGIYPEDDTVKDIDRSMPPTIYKDEYNGFPFSYYAIDKGVGAYWPLSYDDWRTSDITSNDFVQRRKIAALFLKNLVRATEEP